MSDKEKFEGFKRKLIEDNESKYGPEIREKYGADSVDRSNQKVAGMSEEDFAEVTRLAAEVNRVLAEAFASGDPAGEPAQKAVDLHRQWLGYFWSHYSPEAHAGLGQMYVQDERFRAYYDKEQPGTAEFLRDAILIYTGHGTPR